MFGPQVFALGHVLQADELASLIDFKIVQHAHTSANTHTMTHSQAHTLLKHTHTHKLTATLVQLLSICQAIKQHGH